MTAEAPTLPRWAVAVLGALCAIAVGYTLYRGAVVTLEYFDGYQFLVTAKRLAGDRATGGFNLVRPPLLALLDLPALWIARQGAPANLGYTLGPHLTAALLSVLGAGAVFYAFTAALDRRMALLGLVFLITGRLFVRYGSLTMADLLSMAFGALAVGLHVRSMNRPTWLRDAGVGLAIGLGAAAKYPLLLMGAVVLLAELLVALNRRRLSPRRMAGLVVSGAVSALTLLAVLALVYGLAMGARELGRLPLAIREAFTLATGMVRALPGETRWDNAVMLAVTTAWPILALAVLGLALLVKERQERDLPFLAWLVGLGGILIATVGHNEVRYLLPAIPALLYFAVRGAELLLRRAPSPALAGAGVVALALGCSWGGARQAWADGDSAFRADTARRAAAALAQLRRPGGQWHWIGVFSCIYPQDRVPLPRDEFFDSFNFYGPSMLYFLGQPATVIPSWLAAADGDAVVIPSLNCNGLALPAAPPRPWSVNGVRRRTLALGHEGAHVTAEKDLVLSLSGGARGTSLWVKAGLPSRPDAQRMLIVSDPVPRLIGPLPLTTGSEIALGPRDPRALQGIELLELTVVTIPVR